jgi:4-amino-4-deoxy-L-arabinose transferase-like glycosyltransferase
MNNRTIVPDPLRLRAAALIIVGMVLLRLVAAAFIPLTFDEAYYWMWSKNLAGGYYDHPPMVAIVIRIGTMIAGDSEFGVRLVSVLLALPMSWATWRAGQILFDNERVGATAAILLNVTMMAWIGTVSVTPDAPLMAASSFALLGLAKVLETGRGVWWLAVGAAVGAALLSKYNALFLGPTILIWLLAVPNLRHWLISPWPYLGGLLALAMFSPTMFWNAGHDWVSFIKQFGRVGADAFRPALLAGFFATQFLFVTPAVSILGGSGFYALIKKGAGIPGASALINATVWVVVLYFVLHALHEEVHPDWLCQIYPAIAIAAAVAVELVRWRPRWQRVVDFMNRLAVPGVILMVALLFVHIQTGLLSGYRKDEVSRLVGVGFREVAREVESIRVRVGAGCVLGSDYGTTGWLAFYLPEGSCVAQRSDRIRWVNMPEPDPGLLKGKLLLVDGGTTGALAREGFATVETIATLPRRRGPSVVQTYSIELLDGAKGDALDRSPPPELIRRQRF